MNVKRLILTGFVLLAAVLAIPGGSGLSAAGSFIEHGIDSGYYTIRDEQGQTISMMGLTVSMGDYLITGDNKGYVITGVDGFSARARFDKDIDLSEYEVSQSGTGSLSVQGGRTMGPIVTYCTHSSESYVPTSGTESKDWGDIYQVQDTLTTNLRQKGFQVVESKDNFIPHDADAYMRSRRTAAQLLTRRPVMVIDLHRDGIPDANYYRRQVSSQQLAAIRLVVGRQNANRSANFDFAKQIKAVSDRTHPGLVREIFWARGNYNQDLAPRSILMEFGTHKNSLEEAKRGAALMADVISVVLTGTAGGRGAGTTQGGVVNRAAGRTIWWVLGLVVLGAVGFVLLNSGSWDRVKGRFSKFLREDVGLGPKDDENRE